MIGVLDEKPSMRTEWKELFNLASKPQPDRGQYPSKAALIEAYEKAYQRISKAVKAGRRKRSAREFPNPKLRATLPTVGVAMVHILTSHHGLHLGQLRPGGAGTQDCRRRSSCDCTLARHSLSLGARLACSSLGHSEGDRPAARPAAAGRLCL